MTGRAGAGMSKLTHKQRLLPDCHYFKAGANHALANSGSRIEVDLEVLHGKPSSPNASWKAVGRCFGKYGVTFV